MTYYSTPATNPDIEEGPLFTPKFDRDGLIATIVQDASSGQVLMFAYMNAEAMKATIETGFAHYYSRSRQRQWMKGETSGHRQKIIEMLIDCDQDAIILKVETEATGANCHTGRKSCFYRALVGEQSGAGVALKTIDNAVLFDPEAVYKS